MTYVGVPRRCERCNAELHGTAQDQPHLCKDLEQRRKRQQRQINAVTDILREYGVGIDRAVRASDDIVRRLNNLGIEED